MSRPIKDALSLPEKQGARIKRMLAERGISWTSEEIGEMFGIEASGIRKRLLDKRHWKREEVKFIAQQAGIRFGDLYIPRIKAKTPRAKEKLMFSLQEVIDSPTLMRQFFGISLDSKTRDVLVRHLLKLDRYISESGNRIRRRRQRERNRRADKILNHHLMWLLRKEFGGLHNASKREDMPEVIQKEYDRRWQEIRKDPVAMGVIIQKWTSGK